MKDEWSDFSQYAPVRESSDPWSDFSQYESVDAPKEGRWTPGAVLELGRMIVDIPGEAAGALGGLLEDEDPLARNTFADKLRKYPEEKRALRAEQLKGHENERLIPFTDFINRKDIQDASQSTGFSGVSMGASLLGGVASELAVPVPGSGIAGGLAASAAAAYKMDKTQFALTLFDAAEKAQGTALTDKQRKSILDETSDIRNNHALWEAGPEAIGNALMIKGLGNVFKGVSKKVLGKIAGGLGLEFAGEAGTETITQTGQAREEYKAGLTDKNREWTPGGLYESFKEVAPTTAILTGLTGGGAAVAGKFSKQEQQPRVVPDSPDIARANLEVEINDSISKLDNTIAGIESRIQSGIEIYPDGTTNAPNQREVPSSSPLPSAGKVSPIEIYPDGTVTGASNPTDNPIYDLSGVPEQTAKRKYLNDIADNQVSIQQQDDARRVLNQSKQLPAGQGFELVRPENQAKERIITSSVKKQLLKEASALVDEDPTYKIMTTAKNSGGINHESMQDYPAETINQIQKRYPGLISKSGKMHIDEVADQNGMTADELVEQFKSVPTKVKLKKRIYRDLENQWQAAESDRVAAKKAEINKATGAEDIEKEVGQLVEAAGQGVSWAQDKEIANDKRFTTEQENRILEAQQTTPEKLANALGKPEAATNAALSGQTEEQQIGQIVDDAVKQKADLAAMAEAKGKTELATKLRNEAESNGAKLVKADGITTEKKVSEALSGTDTIQPAEAKPADTEQAGIKKPANAEKVVAKADGVSPEKGQIEYDNRAKKVISKVEEELPGHSLRFDGVQEGFGPVKQTYLFTPESGPAKGTTFSVKNLDVKSVRSALEGKVQEYGDVKFSKNEVRDELPARNRSNLGSVAEATISKRASKGHQNYYETGKKLSKDYGIPRFDDAKKKWDVPGNDREFRTVNSFDGGLIIEEIVNHGDSETVKPIEKISSTSREFIKGKEKFFTRAVKRLMDAGATASESVPLAVYYTVKEHGAANVKASKNTKPTTPANIKQELYSSIGRVRTERLLNSGVVNIVSEAEAEKIAGEKFAKDGMVREAVTVGGKFYLIDGNIKKGKVYQAVVHELGSHIFLEGKYKGEKWDKIIASVKRAAKQNTETGKAIREAIDLVPADTLKEHRDSEVLAYYIGNSANQNQTLYRRIIAHIKQVLVDMGFSAGMFNPEDLVVIAQRAVRGGEFSNTNPDIRYSKAASDLTEDQQDFMGSIGSENVKKETLKERYSRISVLLGDKLRQGTVDQFHSLNKILDDKKAWMLAHLTKSDTGVLMTAINTGIPVLDESGAVDIKEGSKSLKEIIKPLGGELDRFLAWIAANRSKKLKVEGRENLFTDDQIKAGLTLNGGELVDGDSRAKLYDSVRKEFEEMGSAITDIAVKTGLVNKEEAKRWQEEGFYVPFYRMIEDQSSGSRGPSNMQSLTNQKAYKKLKGGTARLDDLLTNTLMNWNHLISAGLKNQAGARALETAESMGLATKVDEKYKDKDSIYIRENGKEVWYDLDETPEGQLVLDSLVSLNYEGMNNTAMKGMRMFKRALTAGVTASPGFKIRNLLRDSLHAPAVSTASKNPLKNVFVGIKDKKSMKRMQAGGGAFTQEGYIHGSDPDAIKQLVGVQRDNILDTAGRIKKMWRGYEEFGNTLENINRVASFQNDIKKGKSLLEANFNARDQLDFSRSGSFPLVRILTQTVPFLNARAQGLDKIARSLGDKNQRNQFGQVVGMYTMASIALMLSMQGDDDYDEAEDWEKRTYHLFKVPFLDEMYRLPRPFEVGSIGYVMEEITKVFIDKNQDVKDLGNALQHTITDTFAMSPVPQAFKPLLEIYANKSMFTGRSIESMSMQRLSKKERSKPWTSKTAKGASALMSTVMPESLTLSPVQTQFLVRAYTGWAGSQTLAAIDFIVKKATGEVSPSVKLSEYKWNPLESLSRDKEARSSKYVTKFYNNLGVLSREWADIKKYRESNRGKRISVKMSRRLSYRKQYNKISRYLSRLRKREEAVYNSKSYTAIQKRRRIKVIRAEKNKAAKRIVQITQEFF